MPRLSRSYAVRLALAFAAVGVAGAAVTALAVNLAFGGLLNGYLGQQQQVRQQQVVSLLADSYAAHGAWDPQALTALAPSLQMEAAELRVEDASGRTVWQLDQAGGMMGGPGMRGMMGGAQLGPAQRVPITVDGRVAGTAVIALPVPGNQAVNVAFRDAVNRILLLAGLGAGLLAALVGVVLARRATVPVRELTAAAGELAAGVRERRLDRRSGDEFGAMAEAFNTMADSIAEEDRLRRTFAADVAHELRTPLMILGGQLEALEDGVMEPGPHAIASLQEETRRISRLVSDLEVLASADAARFALERVRFDLAEEAAAVAAEFRPLFDAGSVRLATLLQPAAVVGDPGRIRQVLANLLANALKFTPAGGSVELGLRVLAGSALLEVADSGPGLAPVDLEHVFDRFYRGRGARAGGSGIGLTVVRELVAAHGGSASAGNRPEGGAIFRVTLPLAPHTGIGRHIPASRHGSRVEMPADPG